MSSWSDYAIWWHIYPLGFTGAPHARPGPGARVRTGCRS